jgi:protein-L-isoaspartate(D-aspartate) O-methyltransferase
MGHDLQMAELLAEITRDYRYTAVFTGRSHPDPKVMKALGAVERHRFVPPDLVRYAYENHPLPIGYGQTISQPYIVALMTDFLGIEKDDTILEVGTGCGYQTAVLAQLARKVYSVEIVEPLAAAAASRLAKLGYDNVEVRNGDGRRGWPEKAPFDGIIVTAAAADIPAALFEQLAPDGRLVLPVGEPYQSQHLYLVTRGEGGVMQKRHLLEVAFVPLTATPKEAV